jgi:hypothetical protein
MNGYAMNRTVRSKSNGGGLRFDAGDVASFSGHGTLLSSSCRPIENRLSSRGSFGPMDDLRVRRMRTAVRVCATVSAMPPRTCCALVRLHS